MTSQNNNQSNVQIQLMERVLSNPEYKGKHVVVLDDQVFTANTGDGARQILEKIRREHPGVTPAVTYIPDERNRFESSYATRLNRAVGLYFDLRA